MRHRFTLCRSWAGGALPVTSALTSSIIMTASSVGSEVHVSVSRRKIYTSMRLQSPSHALATMMGHSKFLYLIRMRPSSAAWMHTCWVYGTGGKRIPWSNSPLSLGRRRTTKETFRMSPRFRSFDSHALNVATRRCHDRERYVYQCAKSRARFEVAELDQQVVMK